MVLVTLCSRDILEHCHHWGRYEFFSQGKAKFRLFGVGSWGKAQMGNLEQSLQKHDDFTIIACGVIKVT